MDLYLQTKILIVHSRTFFFNRATMAVLTILMCTMTSDWLMTRGVTNSIAVDWTISHDVTNESVFDWSELLYGVCVCERSCIQY